MNRKWKAAVAGTVALGVLAVPLTANASTRPRTVAAGSQSLVCTYTNPEFLIYNGGASLKVTPGKVLFSSTHAGKAGVNEDPYITAGDNHSLSSSQCNSKALESNDKLKGKSLAIPSARKGTGAAGRLYASAHDTTTAKFRGDAGFDIWYAPSRADASYDQMANGGANSTEIMIWLSDPGLTKPRSYPVVIDGKHFAVTYGLAADGHGKSSAHPHGWNVVNFIAEDQKTGSVSVSNLYLNPFASYAQQHHFLNPNDYLMAVDQGFEMWSGAANVLSYSLRG